MSTEEIPTVPHVPLGELLTFVRLVQRMRKAQLAFFLSRKNAPHSPSRDELIAAKDTERRVDLAIVELLARSAQLPGMDAG